MVPPSRRDLDVVGVFNPAAIRHDGDVVLLLRVAEAPRDVPAGKVAAPIYDAESRQLEIKRWPLDADGLDASDTRAIVVAGRTWLTSISHLRVARSRDGIRFEVEPSPALSPATPYETFGIEDPRITLLDGTYWINYTAVSPYGVCTALASTRDFKTFARHGVMFPPDNKDVTIDMTLTAPGCPVAGEMPGMVKDAVKTVKGIGEVRVNMTFDPPWTPDRMSEEAKLELNMF